MHNPAKRLTPLKTTLAIIALSTLVFTHQVQADDERTAGDTKKQAYDILSDKDYNETYKLLNLFGDVFERARSQYVSPIEDKELIESAVSGMLSSLDPHSSYLNAKSFEDMQVSTRGSFGGLGIEVTMENGFVKVVSPIDDTPAFRADMQAGDYITHIDDEPVLGMTLSDAVDRMRGKVNTKITLTVRREGESNELKKTITRDIIKIKSVRSRAEDKTAYIRITTFNQNTYEGVKTAIKNLKNEIGEDNLHGYVLDLRNNPGGLLDQAISVSDLFLDKGEIVSTRGRDEDDIERDNATSGDSADGKPIVVLINGGSASASEIVAGALQDHKRAIIMGTQSFGKGSVQTIIPIPGHGAMRLTTARYYTPSGRSIQAKGITPDILVEQAKIEKIAQSSISESDLRGALDKTKQKKKKKDSKKDKKTGKSDKPEKEDYQLMRALDLLNGLSLYSDPQRMPIADEKETAEAEQADK